MRVAYFGPSRARREITSSADMDASRIGKAIRHRFEKATVASTLNHQARGHNGLSKLQTVAQQASRKRAGLAPILEGDLTIEHNSFITLGALHPAPLAAGKIMRDLHRHHFEPLEVVNDDVSGRALAQRAAIAETGAQRRMSAQPPVCLFERDHRI